MFKTIFYINYDRIKSSFIAFFFQIKPAKLWHRLFLKGGWLHQQNKIFYEISIKDVLAPLAPLAPLAMPEHRQIVISKEIVLEKNNIMHQILNIKYLSWYLTTFKVSESGAKCHWDPWCGPKGISSVSTVANID